MLLCLTCGLLFASPLLGQDLQPTVPPEEYAEVLLDNYDVVVVGEFVEIPEQTASDLSLKGSMEVVVTFDVSKTYQGYVPSERLAVQLAADMLRYPGERATRYQKRREVLERLVTQMVELDEQLSDLREAHENGVIASIQFQAEEEALLALREDIVSEIAMIPSRVIGAIDFVTFYDLGGSIAPNEEYLIALNRSRENPGVLVLEEIPHISNIFWGRLRVQLTAALDRISGE